MKKLKAIVLIFMTFCLVGCDSSIQKAERTVGLMQDNVALMVGELDAIQNLEDSLQDNFETLIDEDESLEIFQSADNQVEENISQRQAHIDELDQQRIDLEELVPELVELKRNQSLPADEFDEIAHLIDQLTEELAIYTHDYIDNLKDESQAFQSLANPANDYENFFDVIDAVNKLSVNNLMNLNEVLNYFEPLNIHLVNLKVTLINLQEQ